MARSANRNGEDGDSGVPAPSERGEMRELSLEEVVKCYEQPINEEQAWAVCYQCCRELKPPRPNTVVQLLIPDLSAVILHRDGTVTAHLKRTDDSDANPVSVAELVQSIGEAIYHALDWGLDDSEERELSPQLENLIEFMVGNKDSSEAKHCASNSAKDEGYSGHEEEDEEEEEGLVHGIHIVHQVMMLCASRLANPVLAPEHYQAVCRALFLETLELQTFLSKIRDAKEMLKKIRIEESQEENSAVELNALQHTDWARLWVQLMKELRQGVKLKKADEQPFNQLPTEFSLTPFEMLMQDIRSRKYKLRKVVVDINIPTCVKQNAHELILDFIRSRPPLKPVSERILPPPPQQQHSLHEQVLAEIRQDHKLRPVEPPTPKRSFGSLPCLAQTCQCDIKSTSCIDLLVTEVGCRSQSRIRVLLKAPTLAEMEEMNIFEDEDSPDVDIRRVESSPTPLKRDRSFSEHDLDELRGEVTSSFSETPELSGVRPFRGERPRSHTLTGVGPPHMYHASFPVFDRMSPSTCQSFSSEDRSHDETVSTSREMSRHQWMEEFSHPVDSLALTVDEVINVRRILVKAEMEKYMQNKDLYNNLKKGKICCCCQIKFPLFSWPSTCLLCKRSVCSSCSAKMKIPYKKLAHIPVYTVGFHRNVKSHKSDVYKSLHFLCRHSVEEEFPHMYSAGCSLRDVCSDCTKFVADVISSSRRSLDIINNTPKHTKTPHNTSQKHVSNRMNK